jgi:hypothetical protein
MHGSESLPFAVPPISDRERIWNWNVSQDPLIVADANGKLRSPAPKKCNGVVP